MKLCSNRQQTKKIQFTNDDALAEPNVDRKILETVRFKNHTYEAEKFKKQEQKTS